MLNTKIVSLSLGILTSIIFVLCVLYGLLVPPAIHAPGLLEMALPGFKWLTLAGFGVGLVESSLYGALAGLGFVTIYNVLQRRWDVPAKTV